MSEPVVQRALQRMSFRTALAVVFFTGLAAMLCAGNIMTYTHDVWEAVAHGTGVSPNDMRKGIAGAGLGLMLGIVPGVLVDKTTPMLVCFICAAEAFAGFFSLFWAAHGSLLGLSWPAAGVLFFLVGQSTIGVIIQTVAVLAFNAPQARRGFVIGSIVASIALGSLLWSFLEAFVFDTPDRHEYYVLCLALTVPTFYFIAAFLLFKIEKHQGEPEVRPSLPPLFATFHSPPSLLADGTSIDDELAFKSDADYSSVDADHRGGSAGDKGRSRTSQVLVFVALSLVIPASIMWPAMQSEFVMQHNFTTPEVPYLYPGGFVASAFLTGFFSDFFFQLASQYWLMIAGLIGTGSYLITAFSPIKMWYGQQILQGAVLACALVSGISHLSVEFGLTRMGRAVGFAGLPASGVFVSLVAFYYYNPQGLLSGCSNDECLFYSLVFFSLVCFVGAVFAAASAIVAHRRAKSPSRMTSSIVA